VDGVHDLGGMHGFGPVRTPDGGLTHHEPWETRAQAVAAMSGGARRPAIESLDPATYLASSYYVRWLLAAEATLVAGGKVDQADLDRWRATFEADPESPRPVHVDPAVVEMIRGIPPHSHGAAATTEFSVGDPVRVRRMRPEAHHRCPRYLRGAVGEVETVLGADPVPGEAEDVVESCYTVRFSSVDLFGDQTDAGEPPYTLLIDLWERYLEAP
jgi:nitrile hydratase subunit beta